MTGHEGDAAAANEFEFQLIARRGLCCLRSDIRAHSQSTSAHSERHRHQWPSLDAGRPRPLWARNGKELFSVGPDGALLRVPVEAIGATWNVGTPTKLFEGRYYNAGTSGRNYDVSLDGKRFLMIKASGTDAGPVFIVVQHWDEELKRLVPPK